MLEIGKFYWMRQEGVFEDWIPCKVYSFGNRQWIQPIGCSPCVSDRMDWESCEFIEMIPPDDKKENQDV